VDCTTSNLYKMNRLWVSNSGRLMHRCFRSSVLLIRGRDFLPRSVVKPFATFTPSIFQGQRGFSSGATVDKDPEIILYEKSPGHLRIVRSSFGFSCFHSLYWIWYAVDFVPTVNAAQMTELHIDPMFPTAGLVFSVIVQAISTGYPLQLVSKIGWRPSSQEMTVYTHSIPLVRPAATPSVHPVGDIRLDPASVEARKVASLGQLSNFIGTLTIGKIHKWPPYLMDIRQRIEIREPEILLEMLLEPERLARDATKTSNASKSNPQRQSNPKRQARGRKRR